MRVFVGLHKFDPLRFQAGTYCCEDCARLDLTRHQSGAYAMSLQCASCGVGGNMGHVQGQTSKPRVSDKHVLLVECPDQLDDPMQYLRFCYRCYKIAKRHHTTLPRRELMAKIHSKQVDDKDLQQTQARRNKKKRKPSAAGDGHASFSSKTDKQLAKIMRMNPK